MQIVFLSRTLLGNIRLPGDAWRVPSNMCLLDFAKPFLRWLKAAHVGGAIFDKPLCAGAASCGCPRVELRGINPLADPGKVCRQHIGSTLMVYPTFLCVLTSLLPLVPSMGVDATSFSWVGLGRWRGGGNSDRRPPLFPLLRLLLLRLEASRC